MASNMHDKQKSALELLAQVTGNIKASRQEHEQIVLALNTLGEAVKKLADYESEQKPA